MGVTGIGNLTRPLVYGSLWDWWLKNKEPKGKPKKKKVEIPEGLSCPKGTVYKPGGYVRYSNINTTYLPRGGECKTPRREAYGRYVDHFCQAKGPVLGVHFQGEARPDQTMLSAPITNVSYNVARQFCASQGKRLAKEVELIYASKQKKPGFIRNLKHRLFDVPLLWITDRNRDGELFRVGVFRDKKTRLQHKRVETTEVDGFYNTAFYCNADVIRTKPSAPVNYGNYRWPVCDLNAEEQTINFVGHNDFHASYILEENGQNPLSRAVGYFEQIRDYENPYTLFYHSGDFMEKGHVAEPISGGESSLKVFAAARHDVAVIGNHDFAWSADSVLKYSRTPHTIMLGTNIKYLGSNPAKFGAVEFATVQVGCVKIGFSGMVSKGYDERDDKTTAPYYKGKEDYD